MVDDAELDRLMRDGLERRAAGVDVTAPVARQASSAVRRRNRGWLASGFAAASVAAIAVIATLDGTPPEPSDDEPVGPVVVNPSGEWRTEYWADMRVDVPANWGYGDVPVLLNGDTGQCAAGASKAADGSSLKIDAEIAGYVGRPLPRDSCVPAQGAVEKGVSVLPYVWLGVELPVGTVDRGSGFVQETVEVNGSALTVGTDDAALRERIIDSAGGGEMCLSEIEYSGEVMHDKADDGATPTSMSVCVYRSLDPEGRPAATLVYADQVGEDAVASYLRERALAPTPTDLCPTIDYSEYDWVVLELVTDDGAVTDQDIVHLTPCPGIDVAPRHLSRLERIPVTPGLVQPWLDGGILAFVSQERLGLAR